MLLNGPINQLEHEGIEPISETVVGADPKLQGDNDPSKWLLEAVLSLKSGRVEKVRAALENGANPNARLGGKKRTPLHELLRRYGSDKPVYDNRIAEDLAIVQLLLFYGGDVNVKDWQGNSSVRQAIASNVPTSICRALFAKSVEDVFEDAEFKRLYLSHAVNDVTSETFRRYLMEGRVWSCPPDDRWLYIVLGHIIATRKDWPVFMQSIKEETPQDFHRIADQILAFAATFGSAESVEFLLENEANPNAHVKCPILLEAAISAREAKAKIKLLLAKGAVPLTGSFSNCDPSSSLCGAPSRRSAQDARLVAMILAGSNKFDSELYHLNFQYLQPMATEGRKLVVASARPLQMALRLSRLYRKVIANDDSNRQECQLMAEKFEAYAVDMLENASPTDVDTALEDDVLVGSVRNGQKMFLSHSNVQRAVRAAWNGNEQGLCWKQFFKSLVYFLLHIFIYSLASPVVWILTPLHKNKQLTFTNTPIGLLTKLIFSFPKSSMAVVPYVVHAFSLVLFVVFLVILISRGSSVTQFVPMEWVILLLLLGITEEEINQVRRHKLKRYLSLQSINKWLDILVAVLLFLYFLLRVTVVWSSENDYHSHVQRAAVSLLGFITLIACLRIITFLQAHSTLGPIQISFRRVTADVVTFLIILAMFLFGFSTCVGAIYSSYCYVHPNSSKANCTGEMTGQIPESVDGIFNSLQTLFWGLFGIIDLSEFEIRGTDHKPAETVVGTLILAAWMVAALIVMLNLLIALISSSFENVQEHAEIEWKFARAKIVFTGFVQAIPVPLNVLSIPSRYCCYARQTQDGKVYYDINYLAKITWANSQLVEQVQRHWDEDEAKQIATKSDVKMLLSSLDKISSERCESSQTDGRASLMIILQGLREDYCRMEEKLSGRLSEFEKKLSEMDSKINALLSKRSK